MRVRSIVVAALVVGVPGLALAHIGLVSPESRYGRDVLKAGPCGKAGGQRTTDRVYLVKSGATITVTWDEYINHPAHYRVSFDDNGDDDFHEPTYNGPTGTIDPGGFTADEYPTTLVDLIPDKQGGTYTQQVTLPDIACDNCTLQVIQVMYDKPPYDCDTNPSCNDVYHQCVDLVLSADGPDTPTLLDPPDAGPGNAGADAGPGNPGADGGPTGGNTSGGCAAGGSSGEGVPVCLGLVLSLALFRRRRRPESRAVQ